MRSSAAVAALAELLDQMLAEVSLDENTEEEEAGSHLQLAWRALEVLSVMIDNEDAKNKPAKGKQADLSPLQNCLISIVSKSRLASSDQDDDIDDDTRYSRLTSNHCCSPLMSLPTCRALSPAVVYKLADGLLKQSMAGESELEASAE